MPKSCLDGYLTPACATCSDWADGTDDRGLGCACHFPIHLCPDFAQMMREEELKSAREKNPIHMCDKCRHYNKCYRKHMSDEQESLQRAEVDLSGCPAYKELTIEEMFLGKKYNGGK